MKPILCIDPGASGGFAVQPPNGLSGNENQEQHMKALKLVWSGVRFIGLAAWGLLTVASPKADDEANGVDLGGQGRGSWRAGQ